MDAGYWKFNYKSVDNPYFRITSTYIDDGNQTLAEDFSSVNASGTFLITIKVYDETNTKLMGTFIREVQISIDQNGNGSGNPMPWGPVFAQDIFCREDFFSYYDPVVDHHPDVSATLLDSVGEWTQGITAHWGYTSSITIPSQGSITDNTISDGTDIRLSSTGTTFDRVGWSDHTYTIRDDHSVYGVDNTQTTTSRRYVVRTMTPPMLNIVYGSSAVDAEGNSIAGTAYNAEWTNQPLTISGTTMDTGSAYDNVVKKETAQNTWDEAGSSNAEIHTITEYYTESPTTAGEDFVSVLLGSGDHSIILSPESAEKNVKIDKTVPVTSITANSGNTSFTDASTDDKSGVNKTMAAYVAKDDDAPADAAYAEISAMTITTPGEYDVWAYTIDNAGNASVKEKMLKVTVPSKGKEKPKNEEPSEPKEEIRNPETGDRTNVALLLGLFVISVGVIFIVVKRRKSHIKDLI